MMVRSTTLHLTEHTIMAPYLELKKGDCLRAESGWFVPARLRLGFNASNLVHADLQEPS